MDERIFQMQEIYTRIVQLEEVKRLHSSRDASDALEEHIEVLRKRLLELKYARCPRTNA